MSETSQRFKLRSCHMSGCWLTHPSVSEGKQTGWRKCYKFPTSSQGHCHLKEAVTHESKAVLLIKKKGCNLRFEHVFKAQKGWKITCMTAWRNDASRVAQCMQCYFHWWAFPSRVQLLIFKVVAACQFCQTFLRAGGLNVLVYLWREDPQLQCFTKYQTFNAA
jgi:hypothetical protein